MDIDDLLDSLETYQILRREYRAKVDGTDNPEAGYWLAGDEDRVNRAQQNVATALDEYIRERVQVMLDARLR